MAFGKRSASDLPPARPRVDFDGPPQDSLMSAPDLGAVRTIVANPDAIDLKFIALAAGVVVLAAGAAIVMPSLGSVFSGGARPIEQVIAGLDRDDARTALATEAFPDSDGRAFMTSLAANFPREHDRLLDTLADSAMSGGDRDDLYRSLNLWSVTFVPGQMPAIGRTGARGFDEGVTIIGDALKVMEAEIGGCTGQRFQQIAQGPAFFERVTRYDGPAYHLGMRANRSFVELAVAGRRGPTVSTTMTANDINAIQSTFFSMMGDPQIMSLMQAAGAAQNSGYDAQSNVLNNVNFCQLGQTILMKMKGLPEGTKTRLFGTIMTQDVSQLSSMVGFSGPNGNPLLSLPLSN